MRKLVFRIIGFLLLALLLLAIAIPYFFKNDIIAALKTELSEYVDATVDFKDVSIGLFSNFPNLTVDVEDISIKGNAPFEGMELYSASSTAVVVDLASVIDQSTPYQVKAIVLENPEIAISVNPEGKANYDIVKSSDEEPSSEASSYAVALDKFQIINGSLSYADKPANMYASVSGINHTSSGDFTEDVFDVKSENTIANLNVKSGGVSYADHWAVDGDVNINVNLPQNVYTFQNNTVRINDLDLAYNGDVKMDGPATRVNLDFSAPNNSLKSMLSLIPSIYSEDFNQLVASGNTTLSGTVSGVYQDGVSYPSIDFNASIDNGMIQYPDLPEKITGLNAQMIVQGKDSKLRDLMVNIPAFSMQMGGEPINGRCKIDNVMGNPDISAILDGKFDLGMLGKFIEIEDVKSMSGVADTHIELDATYAAIEAQDYNAINFNSRIDAQNIKVEYEGYPTVSIPSGKVVGSPSLIKLDNTNMTIGNSDMAIDFAMNNPLGYALTNQKSNAQFALDSKMLDLNELMAEDASTDTSTETEATANATQADGYAENLKLDYSVNIQKIAYEDYTIDNLKSNGRYENANTRIDQLDMKYMGSNLSTNGNLKNMYGYATKGETLTGDINFKADKINVNDFMTEEEAASNEDAELEVIPVPDNMDITLKTDIRELQYEDYDLKNVNGAIIVKDNVAKLVGFNGNTMGGNIKIDGTYDTKDLDNPMYKFKYDIKQLALQEAFKKSSAVRILAPIAEYIDGNFNSNSSFEGRLGQDMMPDFSTITAEGFLETIRSTVLNFPILEKIGTTLGIEELKSYEIKDSRNWFTVKDGAIEVEEHGFSHDDMHFKVGGKHYINQSIDYLVKAEIPRDKLEKSNVAGVVNSGLDWINQQTSAKGLNLSVGDYVYLDIKIGGTLKKPTIKIIPTGSGGKNLKDQVTDQVKEQANAVKDKVLTKAEAEMERRKEEAMAKGQQEVDKVKDKVTERVNQEVEKGKDAIKEKAKEVVKEQVVDTLTNVVKDKVGDVLGDQAKEEVDKVKDKLKDFNPFKKKKD